MLIVIYWWIYKGSLLVMMFNVVWELYWDRVCFLEGDVVVSNNGCFIFGL